MGKRNIVLIMVIGILTIMVLFSSYLIPATHYSGEINTKDGRFSLPETIPVTIGNGITRTTYYIFQNLTVPVGETLLVNDTNLVIVGQPGSSMYIHDYGASYINDSDISALSSSGVGNVSVSLTVGSSNASKPAIFSMKNSHLDFGGSMNAYNSTLSIFSSSIGIENESASSLKDSLSIDAINCSLYSFNSTYNGFYRSNVVKPYVNGYLNFSGSGTSGPLSTVGYNMVPLKPGKAVIPDAYDDELLVNVTFSGNDSNKQDFINFMENGSTIENYTFPSTGSVDTFETVSIPISNLTPLQQSLAYTTSGFTARYGINGKTTIIIENVSIKLFSNDTEAKYGHGAYNIILHNTTFLSVRDSIPISFQSTYTVGKILDPNRNLIMFYGNSTGYIVDGSNITDGQDFTGMPFLISKGSSVSLYRQENLKFLTPGGFFTNGSCSVSPAMLSSHENMISNRSNSEISGLLRTAGIADPSKSGQGFYFILLDSTINSSNKPVFYGDYRVQAAGLTSYFSLSPYPFISDNSGVRYFNLDLPDIYISSITKSLSIGSSLMQVTIVSTGTVSISNLSLSISGTSDSILFPVAGQTLEAGVPETFQAISKLPPGTILGGHSSQLNVRCTNYTLEGTNFTISSTVTVEPDINLSVAGYSAKLLGNNITVSFNVTNTGLSPGNYLVNGTMDYSNGLIQSKTEYLTFNPDSAMEVSIPFAANFNVSGFNLILDPETNNVPAYTFQFNSSIAVVLSGLHTVNFQQHGLPLYTVWSVSVMNKTYSGFGNSLNISLANGNYTAVLSVYGANFSTKHINFSVNNSNVYLNVPFSRLTGKPPSPLFPYGNVYDAIMLGTLVISGFAFFRYRSRATLYACTECMRITRKRRVCKACREKNQNGQESKLG